MFHFFRITSVYRNGYNGKMNFSKVHKIIFSKLVLAKFGKCLNQVKMSKVCIEISTVPEYSEASQVLKFGALSVLFIFVFVLILQLWLEIEQYSHV